MSRSASTQTVVEVAGGRIRGRHDAGVWRFLGVPYGAAPTGSRRWRPPGLPEPWDGVRDALEPGPVAPQAPQAPGSFVPGDPTYQDEDCLHLSVFSPGLDSRSRPVMVWLHGGGFTGGTAGSVLYDGSHLARAHDVVVVAVNYRLGALGFLAHPALAGPGADWANWGLLDQIAALRWVQRHIASFGGDPGTVCLFGESAGAMSVATLLAMPAARGLFTRAVVQSGPPVVFDRSRATEAAEEVARELGLPEVRRELIERVPAGDLVAAVAAVQARTPRRGELPLPVLPTVDGASLPVHPRCALSAGSAAGVALLIGTNRDELAFFALSDPALATLDEGRMLARLARGSPGADARSVVAWYRRARAGRGESLSPRDVWIAAGSDLVFRWPSLRLAAAHRRNEPRTFVYLFTWETPALGGELGACHGLEIPFVFRAVGHPAISRFSGAGPAAEALSEQMSASWAAFARTGDPSSEPLGAWPPWSPVDGTTMVLGPSAGPEAFPRCDELAVWDALYPLNDIEPMS